MNRSHKKSFTTFSIFSFMVLVWALFTLPTMVFAQVAETDASNSSGSSNSASDSTIDNIKKVIQDKKAELGTGGANLLRGKRAYLAKVLRVSEETLTVSNYSGNKIIPLEESVIIQEAGKDAKISDIAVGNWVGIYGEMISDNLKIKKVEIYEHNFDSKDKIITLGSISMIGKNDLKITPRSGEKELALSFSKKSNFQDYQGKDAKLSDFYEDLQCLVVAFADKNGNYVVSTIRALSTFEK